MAPSPTRALSRARLPATGALEECGPICRGLNATRHRSPHHRRIFAIVDLPNNPLAFQGLRSDPCDDRAERGTKENDYDDFHD
jgi:hypothetical protein